VEQFRGVGVTDARVREREGEMDACYEAGNQLSLDVTKGIVHDCLGVEEFVYMVELLGSAHRLIGILRKAASAK